MHFIPESQLRVARAATSTARRATQAQLVAAADAHLGRDPAAIAAPSRSPVDFVLWDVALGELSVAHLLTEDDAYRKHAVDVARRIWTAAPQREGKKHLFHPWTLSTLATFLDVHRDHLPRRARVALERSIDTIAAITSDRLLNDWGDPARIAWNHMAIAYAAIAKAGLVLPGAKGARWREVGVAQMGRFLDIGVTPAGMTWEGLGYCGYVLRHLAPVVNGLRARGELDDLVPAGSSRHERLLRIPEWYAACVFPQGSWLQNFGDSTMAPHRAVAGLLPMFTPMGSDLALAVWDRLVGASGDGTYGRKPLWSSLADAAVWLPDHEPEPRLVGEACSLERTFHCPDVGFVVTRDRWGPDASVLAFNAGPFPWHMHDHSDNTSYTYIAAGTPLVLDAGAGNRLEEGSPSSTFGHNLVLIDGVGHVPSGQKHGCEGRIVALDDRPEHFAVLGDAKPSYDKDGHNPVRWAYRHIVFLRRPVPCVVVIDDVDKDGAAHRFASMLHVPWPDSGREPAATTATTFLAGELCPDAPPVASVLHPQQVATTWASFGKPAAVVPHRLCVIEAEQATANPHFVTLLAGGPASMPDATVDVRPGASIAVRLAWGDQVRLVEVALHRPGADDPPLASISSGPAGPDPTG